MARAELMPRGKTDKGERSEARRRQILEAARVVFSANGFDHASMAEIAAAVGIVEGALYKHFASKRDLLFACIAAHYAPLVESARRELAGIRGTRNRLRFAIGRQLRNFAEEPGFCRLIIEEIRPRSDYHGSVVRRLNRDVTEMVLEIIREGIESGELRAQVSPKTVRDVVYGGIEHLAWQALSGRGTLEAERLADELTELVWRGLAAEPEARGGEARRLDALEARLASQIDRLERALGALPSPIDAPTEEP